jgi:hypothetical protein
MKRITPTWFMRLRAGFRIGIKVCCGAFTIIATLTGLLNASGMTVPWRISILYGGILSFVLGSIGAYWKGQLTHIPDAFIDETGSESPYTAEFCTGKRLEEACDMTRPFYRTEYVPTEIAEQWRLKNSNGFVDILNANGTLCACFGILAMEGSFQRQFLNGKVSDTQMRGEDVCTFAESKKASHLYISGVVVRDAMTLAGSKRAKVMIWVMLEFVRRFYTLRRKRSLFAVAVTVQSERLLKHLGFTLTMGKKNRVDKCNLYTYELTKSSWQTLLKMVGDYSSLCNLKF